MAVFELGQLPSIFVEPSKLPVLVTKVVKKVTRLRGTISRSKYVFVKALLPHPFIVLFSMRYPLKLLFLTTLVSGEISVSLNSDTSGSLLFLSPPPKFLIADQKAFIGLSLKGTSEY